MTLQNLKTENSEKGGITGISMTKNNWTMMTWPDPWPDLIWQRCRWCQWFPPVDRDANRICPYLLYILYETIAPEITDHVIPSRDPLFAWPPHFYSTRSVIKGLFPFKPWEQAPLFFTFFLFYFPYFSTFFVFKVFPKSTAFVADHPER